MKRNEKYKFLYIFVVFYFGINLTGFLMGNVTICQGGRLCSGGNVIPGIRVLGMVIFGLIWSFLTSWFIYIKSK